MLLSRLSGVVSYVWLYMVCVVFPMIDYLDGGAADGGFVRVCFYFVHHGVMYAALRFYLTVCVQWLVWCRVLCEVDDA